MKDENAKVFHRIRDAIKAHEYDRHVKDMDEARWILTGPADKSFLKHATVVPIRCLPARNVYLLTLTKDHAGPGWPDGRVVIAIPDREESCFDTQFSGAIIGPNTDAQAGVYTLLWGNSSFELISDKQTIFSAAENLFGKVGGISYSEVVPYFSSVSLWDVDPREFSNVHPEGFVLRVYGAYLLRNARPELLPDLTENARSALWRLLEDGVGRKGSHNIFRALSAAHLAHAYVDVYRCAERLFSAPYVRDFCGRLGSSSSLKVGSLLENLLGWRPREEDALVALMKAIGDDSFIQRCAGVWRVNGEGEEQGLQERTARAIYRQRNGLVHFRHGDRAADPTIEEFTALCDLVWRLCRTFSHEIMHQDNETQT